MTNKWMNVKKLTPLQAAATTIKAADLTLTYGITASYVL